MKQLQQESLVMISSNKSPWLPILVLFFLFPLSSYALSPEPKLADEKQEQRAMALFLEVRCLVCNGQVIENSDTQFSFEMRQLIRQKIKAGESDEEIKNYLKTEFGADILTEINHSGSGILLWLLPLSFAILFILFNLRFFKQ